ncbi:unnamed protein product [Dovyalis caffra]|uniref:Uncharacterized protein n=1 Tax=Dovyalis caffra TaxID=77055 RepID=A0AAV1QQH8_9ROSI|nr:unnamed protein product [Dovyalis caffra]
MENAWKIINNARMALALLLRIEMQRLKMCISLNVLPDYLLQQSYHVLYVGQNLVQPEVCCHVVIDFVIHESKNGLITCFQTFFCLVAFEEMRLSSENTGLVFWIVRTQVPFVYFDVFIFTLWMITVEKFSSDAAADDSCRHPGEEFQPVLHARLVFQS